MSDIVVEWGNARYQDTIDRFVGRNIVNNYDTSASDVPDPLAFLVSPTLVSRLEMTGTRVFTVWTNTDVDLEPFHPGHRVVASAKPRASSWYHHWSQRLRPLSSGRNAAPHVQGRKADTNSSGAVAGSVDGGSIRCRAVSRPSNQHHVFAFVLRNLLGC